MGVDDRDLVLVFVPHHHTQMFFAGCECCALLHEKSLCAENLCEGPLGHRGRHRMRSRTEAESAWCAMSRIVSCAAELSPHCSFPSFGSREDKGFGAAEHLVRSLRRACDTALQSFVIG